MARAERHEHEYAFAPEGDFNEQLYDALRKSPWWLLSILIHGVVIGVLMLFGTGGPAAEPGPVLKASTEQVPQEEVPEVDEETEELKPEEVIVEKPMITDEVPLDRQTDNDLDYNETFGQTEGLSDAPFTGPSSNGTIGIGGGAGGAFKGRGGRADGGGGGGRKKFNDALEDALRWLAAHQSPDGGWEAATFMNYCDGKIVTDESKKPDGAGKPAFDAGVTGLALCAFLGAGYTQRSEGLFGRVVGLGLNYLRTVQDPEGCFGNRSTQQYIYNHATASLAMVEAYGMTESPILKGSAQGCLDFIALTRNPYAAWRYGIKPGSNDTSVTGWMMMALKSAQMINEDAIKRGKPAPLTIDDAAFDGIRTWLDKVTDVESGRVGYQDQGTGPARPLHLMDRFPGEKSESMTAVGLLARIFMKENPRSSPILKKGAELCLRVPPTWNREDGSIDMYYWYYATLAIYQMGSPYWDKWRDAMEGSMVNSQRKETDSCLYKGSWDPIGPWGPDGGRVYSTAIMALCLEVFYRYERVFGTMLLK